MINVIERLEFFCTLEEIHLSKLNLKIKSQN